MLVIRVKVETGVKAKKERFEAAGKELFVAEVKEKPEHNAANKRVRELAAAYFKIPVGAVRIITGHRSPNKTIAIRAGDTS